MSVYQKLHRGYNCLNLVLLLFINTTPLWFSYSDSNQHYLVGLWSACSSYQCQLLTGGVYPNAIRALSVSAILPCLLATLSSWDIFTRCTSYPLPEFLICSVGNFLTAICTMGALMMTVFMIRIVSSTIALSLNFYIGCFICSTCSILGILSLFQHIQKLAKREFQVSPNSENAADTTGPLTSNAASAAAAQT